MVVQANEARNIPRGGSHPLPQKAKLVHLTIPDYSMYPETKTPTINT